MKLARAIVCAASLLMAAGIRRPLWVDMPEPARAIAGQIGINAGNFAETLASIDNRTAARLREGEWDALIYYILQSRSFIDTDPIEPARSAAEFVPSRKIPPNVETRVERFLLVLQKPSNERQKYFSQLHPSRRDIEQQYARAMQFLYAKEVRCREKDEPQACIAELYTSRGLSSDTNTQSFRIVEAALEWIKDNRPGFAAHRVLILGPGLDFSPRTGLREDAVPRVYQPDQVKRLLQPDRVDCVDVNPLVIDYARKVCNSTYSMNIATSSLEPAPGWDLIIATNILLYLDDAELFLAIGNVRHMLNPGGLFIHNDARFQMNLFGRAWGLPVIHFGDIVLDKTRKPPLTDRYVLHEGAVPGL